MSDLTFQDSFPEEIRKVFRSHEHELDKLCFRVERFLCEDFHVDEFVSDCKDNVSLQTLREDLEKHYKNIRMALIELINQDYADFVNLSSNLVGMEKSIQNLSRPLGQLREEVGVVKSDLSSELSTIEDKLKKRKEIRAKKTKLQHLLNVVNSVQKIEKILLADPNSKEVEIFMEANRDTPGHFLERVAGEFNQLQFHVSQSKGHPLIEEIKPRVALITSKLQESLEASFQEGLMQDQSDLVLRCLRTYALIDKTSHAEELFKHTIVKPFMEDVISEKTYNSEGLEEICRKVLNFVSKQCKMLVNLTSENHSQNGRDHTVKGFDFLVNSVWPEVDNGFESRLPFIFSPGNPDAFFERYNIMMKFLDGFEEQCTSFASFKRLRAHPSYHSFITKWSLPVYFQVRLQEIGGGLETAIDDPFKEGTLDMYSTNVVEAAWTSLCKCWDDKVYITPLTGRFLKLFLQILNRLAMFMRTTSESLLQPKASQEKQDAENLSQESQYGTVEIARLYGDISKLSKKASEYYKTTVEKKLLQIGVTDVSQHECAFQDSVNGIVKSSTELSKYLVKVLSDEGSQQLENAKNVPRLYRRTNREPPSQASAYVSGAFKSLQSFKDKTTKTIEDSKLKSVLEESVLNMTTRYFSTVDEIVTSIRKTEESLLRLKRLRKGGDTGVAAGTPGGADMSDENKIRKQLYLDAEEFGKQVTALGLKLSDNTTYGDLMDLVSNAMKQSMT